MADDQHIEDCACHQCEVYRGRARIRDLEQRLEAATTRANNFEDDAQHMHDDACDLQSQIDAAEQRATEAEGLLRADIEMCGACPHVCSNARHTAVRAFLASTPGPAEPFTGFCGACNEATLGLCDLHSPPPEAARSTREARHVHAKDPECNNCLRGKFVDGVCSWCGDLTDDDDHVGEGGEPE